MNQRTVLTVDNGVVRAFRETINSVEIPARKLFIPTPSLIENFAPGYAPYTTAFSLATIGREWCLFAEIKRLSVNLMTHAWLRPDTHPASSRIVLCPDYETVGGASKITHTRDGKAIQPTNVRMEFDISGTLVLAMLNGTPYVFVLHAGQLFACLGPNIHGNGRVCQDHLGKYLVGEVNSRPDQAADIHVTRSSPKTVLAATLTDLFFTSPNNPDIKPPAGVFWLQMAEDAPKLPTGQIIAEKLVNTREPATSPMLLSIATHLNK